MLNYKQFIKEEYKERSGGQRFDDFIDTHVGDIAKKLGYKPIKRLGSGSFGLAYLLNDNKVLKITIDRHEYLYSKRLVGKKLDHFPTYYGSYKINLKDGEEQRPTYIIILDYIRPLTKKEKKYWNNIITIWKSLSEPDKFIKKLERRMVGDDAIEYFKPFIGQYESMKKEANKHNVSLDDLHTGNIGIRDGKVVHFDLSGFYNSEKEKDKEKEIIIDNNKYKKIRDYISNNYDEKEKIPLRKFVNEISKLLNINKVKAYKLIRDEVYFQSNFSRSASLNSSKSPVLLTFVYYGSYNQEWIYNKNLPYRTGTNPKAPERIYYITYLYQK